VREDVLQQDVRAGGEVVGGYPDEHRSRLDLHAHPARLVFGQRPPERSSFPDHPRSVAAGCGGVTLRSPRLVDDLAHGALHRVYVVKQRVSQLRAGPQRLGVYPQRGQRRAQPVG